MNDLKISKRLENTIASHHERVCLRYRDSNATYAQMVRYAESLLAQVGAGKNNIRRIAFLADHSLLSYVSIFACALTNRTFIPLPMHVSERLRKILDAADVDVIIVDKESFNEIPRDFHDKVVVIDLDKKMTEQGLSAGHNTMIYILFTSGSTGIPKGVPISQENLLSFCDYNLLRYQITPEDIFSQTFAQTFDLAMFNIFMAWFSGASIAIPSENDRVFLNEYIEDHQISIWFCVPSMVSMIDTLYAESMLSWPSIRLSLFCGEGLRVRDLLSFQERVPNAVIENVYGPTELTISCTAYRIDRANIEQKQGIVAIGRAYPHLKAAILLPGGSHATLGRGELCIAGAQRFQGYLKNEEYRIAVIDGVVYLRTGDEVEIDAKGMIFYIGRLDLQVKINGYRVELREIETVIESSPLTKRCICVASKSLGQDVINAFVDSLETPAEIKKRIESCLPAYMIPQSFVKMSNMPLNANGKIDRKAFTVMIGTSELC